jgi:hypothetical protein
MCYEFESWHWKTRTREQHKVQENTSRTEPKREPVRPLDDTERKRPEVKVPEKVPA